MTTPILAPGGTSRPSPTPPSSPCGTLRVGSGGSASYVTVASSGALQITAGGTVNVVNTSAGATIIDNGVIDNGPVVGGSLSSGLSGSLSGSGQLVENGSTALLIAGDTTAFTGSVVISGGEVILANPGELSNPASTVMFAAASASAELMYTSAVADADAFLPPTLINFDQGDDSVDLGSVSFVSGADRGGQRQRACRQRRQRLPEDRPERRCRVKLYSRRRWRWRLHNYTPTAMAAARLAEVTASFAASGTAGAMTTHSPILTGMARTSFAATETPREGTCARSIMTYF